MTYRDEVYHCSNCGAEVKVKKGGSGTLICCGKPMEKLEPGETEPDAEDK